METEKTKEPDTQPSVAPPWNFIRSTIFIDPGESKKRLDIQGLRAFAIVLVYCFHFLPDTFPNGYLGVDMFFILSGYLMALVLSREKSIGIKNTLEFYYRRAKRIIPCFYLVVFLTILSMTFVMSIPWLEENSLQGRHALFFGVNVKNMRERNQYFLQNHAVTHTDLFLHSWSLCVEMQFYIIVPLIFFFLKNVFLQDKYLCVSGLLVCAMTSWWFNWSLLVDPIRQFNHPLSRGWQFLLGTIAFVLSLPRDSEKRNLDTPRRLLSACALQIFLIGSILCWFSFTKYDEFTSRSAVTLITAFSLVIGSHSQSILISSSLLTYIGDASYALYLTHWPIIKLAKYYGFWHEIDEVYVLLAAFLLSVVSALLVHHFIEKKHLEWGKPANIVLSIGLFVAALAISFAALPLGETLIGVNREAVLGNMAIAPFVYKNPDANFTKFDGYGGVEPVGLASFPPGNGTITVLVTGNSYASQMTRTVRKLLNGRFKTIHLFSRVGNQVIGGGTNSRLADTNVRLVKQLKPDIVIVATRLEDWQLTPLLADDPQILEGTRRMNAMAQHCKHILIVGPHPRFPRDYINMYIDRLQRNLPLEGLNLNKTVEDIGMFNARRRFDKIIRQCKKCELVNTAKTMEDLEHNQYQMFDPVTKLAYAENSMHYTLRGLEKIEPAFARMETFIRQAERGAAALKRNNRKRKQPPSKIVHS